MKYTNKNNLPDAIYNAIAKDGYSSGGANYTASMIEKPPQLYALAEEYKDELVTDVSELIFPLLGTSMHYILEKSNDNSMEKTIRWLGDIKTRALNAIRNKHYEEVEDILSSTELVTNSHIITEQRLFMNLGRIVVSGQTDVYNEETKTIQDYKVTSVWKVKRKSYDEWISQLNTYKLLLESNGYEVKKLQIVAILRDWSKAVSKRSEDYPDSPVQIIDIPVKDSLDTLEYVLDKIKHFEKAKTMNADELYESYPCSLEDKWGKESYKVWKKGNSRATKVFEKKDEAVAYASKLGEEYEVRVEGSYIRCEEYCPVKDYCTQYKKEHSQVVIEVKPVEKPKAPEPSKVEEPSKGMTTEERVAMLLNKNKEPKEKSIDELFKGAGL